MAQLARTFAPVEDAEQRRGGSYEKLPNGIYELEIESSKPNENNIEGTLFRLDVVYNVRAPEEYANQKVFDRFYLVHTEKPKGEEFGNRQFTFLCNAIGHKGPVEDSEDLHLRPFFAEIGLGKPYQKKENGVPAKNDDGSPMMVSNNEVKYFFDPNKDDEPEVGVFPEQTKAANDNARAVANDNRPAPVAAAPAKKPWGARK